MKIAVIGATNNQGGLIVQEALKRGHQVTAIVQNRAKVMFSSVSVLEKDVYRLTTEDVTEFDAVINAFLAPSGKEEEYGTVMQHLISILEQVPQVRLLAVGDAGLLYEDVQKTALWYQSADFPSEQYQTAAEKEKALNLLKTSQINWACLSPSVQFDLEGLRTGRYLLGEDCLITNSAGISYVSCADYAIAMMDEIEKTAHIRQHFTVASEQLG